MKILTSVELGSPAADCAHFGICSVDVITPEQWATFQPRHIRQVKALVSVTSDGGLCLNFPFDGMREDTRVQFFPQEGFRMDSAKTLPSCILEALGLPAGLCTLPGVYPLVVVKDGFEMFVTLVASERALALAA